jgi:hypothetical protein
MTSTTRLYLDQTITLPYLNKEPQEQDKSHQLTKVLIRKANKGPACALSLDAPCVTDAKKSPKPYSETSFL